MGVIGLLPKVQQAIRRVPLKELKGKKVGVDASIWLYECAYPLATHLVKGRGIRALATSFMNKVKSLIANGLILVLVFDGENLPAKSATDNKRNENKALGLRNGIAAERAGRLAAAKIFFKSAITIKREMVEEVARRLRDEGIEYIVAPYESDAELAFLEGAGLIDVICTEDSDLIVYGVKRIMFKLDVQRSVCDLYESTNVATALGISDLSHAHLPALAAIVGCDYAPSIRNIGIVNGLKTIQSATTMEAKDVLSAALTIVPSAQPPPNFESSFDQAVNTYIYQIVFDPKTRVQMPLHPHPVGTDEMSYSYCGVKTTGLAALRKALLMDSMTEVSKYIKNVKDDSIWKRSSSGNRKRQGGGDDTRRKEESEMKKRKKLYRQQHFVLSPSTPPFDIGI